MVDEPLVTNGLALCKPHHTAFDAFFLLIRPDYVIEIRRNVLEEVDGPVLKHALQGLHGARRIGWTGSGWNSGIRGFWRRGGSTAARHAAKR
jgi:hypothetical protein